jgi:filamentous hemagglutinin
MQQAGLTSDIVWFVPEEVGGRTVLAPKLYLAPGDVALQGATIAAKNVSLTAGGLNNSGTISGSDSLSITTTSGDLVNSGTLAGGTVSLVAMNRSWNGDVLRRCILGVTA